MVEILNGLAGSAFAKIVETRNDNEALAGLIQDEADVAEISVSDVLELGQRAGRPDTNHGAAGVELAIKGFYRFRRLLGGERDVNGRENAARERKQVS